MSDDTETPQGRAKELRRRCKIAIARRHSENCPVGKHCEDPHCVHIGDCSCGMGGQRSAAELAVLALAVCGDAAGLRGEIVTLRQQLIGLRKRAERAEARLRGVAP